MKIINKKLIMALPRMLPHNKQLHGFQLFFLFHVSAKSPFLLLPRFSFLIFPQKPPLLKTPSLLKTSSPCFSSPSSFSSLASLYQFYCSPFNKTISISTTTMARQQCPWPCVPCRLSFAYNQLMLLGMPLADSIFSWWSNLLTVLQGSLHTGRQS